MLIGFLIIFILAKFHANSGEWAKLSQHELLWIQEGCRMLKNTALNSLVKEKLNFLEVQIYFLNQVKKSIIGILYLQQNCQLKTISFMLSTLDNMFYIRANLGLISCINNEKKIIFLTTMTKMITPIRKLLNVKKLRWSF